MPRICVVMPAFNEHVAIAKAIGSIRAQTYQDWEMRVVDDGSEDGTYEAAVIAADGDPRIHVMRNTENRGSSFSKNIGWSAGDSEFVAILDSDDVAEPARLALTTSFMDGNRDITVVGGGAWFVDEKGRFIRKVLMPATHEKLRKARWHRAPFIHSTVLMRRSFLEQTGGYPEDLWLGEDSDLWMRGFIMPGVRYANLSVPLVTYQTYHVQRWKVIQASARVHWIAGQRENRIWRGGVAGARTLVEGAVEQTGVYALMHWLKNRVKMKHVD